MCTVFLAQGVNPTTVNQCINTSTYTLCLNCTAFLPQVVNPNAVNKCINTSTYSLFVIVCCATAAGCQPNNN